MKNSSLFVYQGIPLAVILLPFVWFGITGSDNTLKGEFGIIENLTVIFLIAAIGFCCASLFKVREQMVSCNLKSWLILLVVGSTYFALEEISYGQHLFGWGTAQTWKEINDQGETNLHNVHAVFDQWPRALLTVGIFFGGLILPLYRHFRNISLNGSNRFYWQLPTIDCVTISLIVVLTRPVFTLLDLQFILIGETKENFIALFILLYCISIHGRLCNTASFQHIPSLTK